MLGWKPAGVLVVVILCACESVAGEADFFRIGRQNPILRRYFRIQSWQSQSQVDRNGVRRFIGTPGMLERQTNWLIEEFLSDLRKDLALLRGSMNHAREARSTLLSSAVSGSFRAQSLAGLARSLRHLADKAGDLRRTISFPLAGRTAEASYKFKVDPSAERDLFGMELAYVASQVDNAAKSITDYFFRPTFTVSVSDLASEDMLLQLERVRVVAIELSRALESSARKRLPALPAGSG